MTTSKRQPRLSVREVTFRDRFIRQCWDSYKNELTMQEMSHIFRMDLCQFFKIVKSKKSKKS